MQRIIIEKNEAVADLIERILEIQDREIVLVVPKGSRLTDSPSNFRLIAREAGVLAKDISIESVDQEILSRAKAAGIVANHPLFGDRMKGAETQSFSDIVSRGAKKKLKVKLAPEPEAEPEAEAEPIENRQEEEDEIGEDMPVVSEVEAEEVSERYDTLEEPRRGRGRKVLAWVLIAVILVAGGMWLTAYAFGKATISITFQKVPWTYGGALTAMVSAKDVNADAGTLPVELAEPPQQTLTKFFKATGHTTGGQKAHATLTIVNNYSAASQELVATTRFVTPDGKIFRLDNATVVPGAKVTDGTVVASSTINAAVTADQPGIDYNVGPIAKLNIPGFQGTPKYVGFYGILAQGASGGSSTGGAAPTSQDIAAAESQMASALNSAFQTTFLTSIPSDFKVLPQAAVFSTSTFSVNSSVDAQGQFAVTATTVFHAFEFREQDVIDFLNAKARQSDANKVLQDLTINYTNVSPNFTKKQLTFTIDAKGTLTSQFDPAVFAASVAGKSQSDARQAILALPGLADAKVSLWPAWLWGMPKNPSKIIIQVQ